MSTSHRQRSRSSCPLRVVVVAATLAPSCGPRGPGDPRMTALVDWTASALRAWAVPGAAIAVVEDGELRFTAGVGHRDAARSQPVTPDTAFRVGSISKLFTGMVAMQASTEGWLDLVAPASEALGNLELQAPDSLGQVTLMQLLSHQSGLQSGGVPEDCEDDVDADARVLAEEVPGWSLWSPPGALYNYSNSAFALVGHALELASGQEYASLVEERLFATAELGSATFDPDQAEAGPWAEGAVVDPETGAVLEVVDLRNRGCRASFPSGGLIASAVDLGRVMEVLLDEGAPWLTPAQWAEVQSTGWVSSGGSRYSFGLRFSTWRDMPIITHSGAITGYLAILWVMPEQDLGVAVLVNADHAVTDPPEPWSRPTERILLQALELFLGLEHEDPASSVLDPSDWTRFEGSYVGTDGQGAMELAMREGELWMVDFEEGEERLLYPYASSTFQYPYTDSYGQRSWKSYSFLDGDDDAVDWMTSRVGIWRRLGGPPPGSPVR